MAGVLALPQVWGEPPAGAARMPGFASGSGRASVGVDNSDVRSQPCSFDATRTRLAGGPSGETHLTLYPRALHTSGAARVVSAPRTRVLQLPLRVLSRWFPSPTFPAALGLKGRRPRPRDLPGLPREGCAAGAPARFESIAPSGSLSVNALREAGGRAVEPCARHRQGQLLPRGTEPLLQVLRGRDPATSARLHVTTGLHAAGSPREGRP